MGTESMHGPMVVSSKETGKTTTCMERESTLGLTGEATKVIMKTTKSMDRASTHGAMVDSIVVSG